MYIPLGFLATGCAKTARVLDQLSLIGREWRLSVILVVMTHSTSATRIETNAKYSN